MSQNSQENILTLGKCLKDQELSIRCQKVKSELNNIEVI